VEFSAASSKEFRLLLYCARSRPNAERIAELAREDINWLKVVDLANRHDVRPLLRQALKSVCWDSVPHSARLELDRFYKRNVQRSLVFAGELFRLLGEFERNGIPTAVLKGIVLAKVVYGDIFLREFSDLDLLVHESDVSKAEDILTACGYQADFPDKDYRSAFLKYQGQYAFRNKQDGISVDLHWRLSGKAEAFAVSAENIWPRLERITMYARTVPTLAHDDLALFLAAHGTKEGWKVLKWVCDFAEFLQKNQNDDWLAVLHRAEQRDSSRPLLLAMLLARTLLDAPAPPGLIDKARNNPAVRALAEKAQRRMLLTAPEGELRNFLNGLNTHDRLRDRLWPVATLVTTRTVGDYQAMPVPRPLWGIYYVTRPFRLAAKAAEMISRR
jgi:hypothetical protein